MQSKLSRVCDGVIEAGWLVVLVVTPLFFNTLSSRVFEPDKIHLLRSVVAVMGVAWLVQLVDGGWRNDGRPWPGLWASIRRTPLVLPALALVGAYLLSTALSIVPRISLLGSYVRLQGTYTFLSYVAVFAMVLTHLRTRAQMNRLSFAVILTSLPISIYGVVQHYGLDPLPWGGDVRQRVAANMGNAIFVAAYLIIAVFLTLERLVGSVRSLLSEERGATSDALRAGSYLFVLVLQLVAILFTQSRGPWLGLAAGLYVFTMVGVLLAGRWAAAHARAPGWLRAAVRPVWLGLIGLTLAVIAFLVVINLPQGPLARLRDRPYIGRMASVLNTREGTNAVRVLIWEGVVDMMLRPHPPIQMPDGTPDAYNILRPLVGYGPESMWVAYNRFYPPDLAHYEARNASPDRAHNETFDALARTGLLGFCAQLYLFVSVFYWSLRWLGLMQGRQRRNLFLAMLAGGAALGVAVPGLVDGSLRLAGIGLPAGLMAGMILYLTIDLLLGAANGVDVAAAAPLAEGEAIREREREATSREAGPAPDAYAEGRQLLILAVFSGVVAFFVEVHFGIAIVSTLTLFWTLAALLVIAGMGWIREQVRLMPEPAAAPTHATRRAVSDPSGRASRRDTRAGRKGGAPVRPEAKPSPSDVQAADSPLVAFLPYAFLAAIVTLVLTWDFLVNQTGAERALGILVDAFTKRLDKDSYRVIMSPMLLVMVIFTWLVGGILAWAESSAAATRAKGISAPNGAGHSSAGRGLAKTVVYLLATVGVFLAFGFLAAGRLLAKGLAGMEVLHRVASQVAFFDVWLLMGMLGLAAAIIAAERLRPVHFGFRRPALSLACGLVVAILALVVIVRVNIRTVQADIFYKQGLAYEEAGAWEGAVLLYREALALEPNEDFYYLFLGRALLQVATLAQGDGAAATNGAARSALPENLDGVNTGQLLQVIDQGLRSLGREDLFRATQAALVAAQRHNPLNTDHTANLARLLRAWAFSDARFAEVPDNQALRDLVREQPDVVDLEKLALSERFYRGATSLSPQNAQLWNEMATVQFLRGDHEGALVALDRSLALDPRYSQTYLLRGDVLADAGDRAGALETYRQAAALSPGDVSLQSAVGVLSAQLGETEAALAAFRRISEQELAALQSAERQLAEMGASPGDGPSAATDRRSALERAIAIHRSQLHLNYRNMAIVLRDAGRLPEALEAAQAALDFASDGERAYVEALIEQMRGSTG